ncbi:hypothetical protein CJ030_MR7G001522 [Morella rubra]|uniref:Uncharacterized protein n=1 Tax=Morella rubra TaxID=262757 RepID=A0A6A1V1T3_9ROSI|nr:hypothetical protein CJ030_MR7G001522 [Morella rubra]
MSHNSGKSVSNDATTLADPKVFMEAMVSEMRRMMKFEMEQVHERIDRIEQLRIQAQNGPNFVDGKEFHGGRRGWRMKSLMDLVLRKKRSGILLLAIGNMEAS